VSPLTAERVREAKISLRLTFFFMGMAVAATSARFAEIRGHVGINVALFGYGMMVGNVGAIFGNLIGSKIALRIGTRRLAQLVMIGVGGSQIAYGFINAGWQVPIVAFCAGTSYSLMNVACNSQGSMIQEKTGRSLMPSFHGTWSIGAFTASLAAGFIARHFSVESHLVVNSLIAIFGVFAVSRALLPQEVDHQDRSTNDGVAHDEPLPQNIKNFILFVAVGSLLASIAEVSVGDWSSILIHDSFGLSASLATLGYTSFVLAQILGRFTVGRIIDRLDIPTVIRFGGFLGGASYVGGLIAANLLKAHHPHGALISMCIGYAVLGLGVSPMPPSYVSVAGSIPGVPTTRAIARMQIIGSAGFLVGRFCISSLAGIYGLSLALFFPAAAIIGCGVLAYRLDVTRIKAAA